jgi:hypothetical protein
MLWLLTVSLWVNVRTVVFWLDVGTAWDTVAANSTSGCQVNSTGPTGAGLEQGVAAYYNFDPCGVRRRHMQPPATALRFRRHFVTPCCHHRGTLCCRSAACFHDTRMLSW